MLALVIIASIITIYFAITFSTIIAYETLNLKAPLWLDTLYDIVTFQWHLR